MNTKILGLAIVGVFFLVVSIPNAQAIGIFSNLANRTNLTIYYDGANTLTDYQVYLEIPKATDMNSDYSDLNFSYYNYSTGAEYAIDYYIDNYTATIAHVWVEIPYIQASVNSTISLYSDNSTGITSSSNGTRTFLLYEDCNDVSDWSWTSPALLTSNSTITYNGNTCRWYGQQSFGGSRGANRTWTNTSKYYIYWTMLYDGQSSGGVAAGTANWKQAAFVIFSKTNTNNISAYGTTFEYISPAIATNWYQARMYLNNTVKGWGWAGLDDRNWTSWDGNRQISNSSAPNNYGAIQIDDTGNTYTFLDNIFITKSNFPDSEPSPTFTEEGGGGGGPAGCEYPASGDWNITTDTDATCINQNITMTGDITIYGNLTLSNTTVWFNSPSCTITWNAFGDSSLVFLNAFNGSYLNIINGSVLRGYSTAPVLYQTANQKRYYFFIDSGSHFYMNSSKIQDVGTCFSGTGFTLNSSHWNGPWFNTTNIIINNSIINNSQVVSLARGAGNFYMHNTEMGYGLAEIVNILPCSSSWECTPSPTVTNITFDNVTVHNVLYGGGICMQYGSTTYVTIKNSEFYDIRIGGGGSALEGGICTYDGTDSTQQLKYFNISNNRFHNNYNGGISFYQGSGVISNWTISNNQFYNDGKGIFIHNGIIQNMTIKNNNMTSNMTTGIDYISTGGAWKNSTFYNNNITTSSYGLYLMNGGSNIFYDNRITSTGSYAVYLSSGGSTSPNRFYNNIFNGSSVGYYFSGTKYQNYWNTTNQTGTNIWWPTIGYIGGNYYTNAAHTGYSDTCADTNANGYCDTELTLNSAGPNKDYLPISNYSTLTDNPPQYSGNITIYPTTYSPTTITKMNVTWLDDSAISIVRIESNYTGTAVNYTATYQSGSLYSYAINLPAGTYYWKSYANDSANQWNTLPAVTFTIGKATLDGTVTCNDTDWYMTYPSAVIIDYTETNDGDADVEYKLYQDDVEINPGDSWLPVYGEFIYKLNTTLDTYQNYSYSTSIDTKTLTVSETPIKIEPTIHLELNGTEGNVTYDIYPVVNITGWVETGDTTTIWYYQENATSIKYDAAILDWPQNFYDNNWDTYSQFILDGSIYINYTKPSDAIAAAWQLRWDAETSNYSMSNDCFAQDPIQLRISRTSSLIDTIYCYTGIYWYPLDSHPVWPVGHKIYEDGMWWGSSNSTLLYIDGAVTTNPYVGTLGLGTHNITFYYPESTNYDASTITYYATVYSSTLVNLSSTYLPGYVQTLNITLWNETTRTNMTGTVDATFFVWDQYNTSMAANFSFRLENSWNYTIWIYPNITTYLANAVIQYYAPGYATREYNIYEMEITNSTQEVQLYDVLSSESSNIVMTTWDTNSELLPNHYIQIQRYYPELNEYYTVAAPITDEKGMTNVPLIPYKVWYRFIVMNDGVIQDSIGPMLITSTTLTLTVQRSGKFEYYIYNRDIGYSCEYNNDTSYLSCTVVNTNNLVTSGCLNVTKKGILVDESTCYNCVSGSSFSLSCYLGENPTGTYFYQLTMKTSFPASVTDVIYGGSVDFASMVVFGLEGVILSLLVIGSLSFMGLWNPAVGIILSIIGFAATMVLGLIPPLWGLLTTMGCVGIVIIYKVKT